jgi:hypothetical protein
VNSLRLKRFKWARPISMMAGFVVLPQTTPALIGMAFTANPFSALAILPLLVVAIVATWTQSTRQFVDGRLCFTERRTRLG